jgi:hypothetical protein
MKRTVFITVMLAMVLSASAQQRSVILPGNAKIDVEKLNKQIPLNMDVSKLSISEARVLRNAFAARQGYCFMSGDLRSIFEATSWYGEKMNDRFWEEEDGKAKPLTYTDAEKAFMQKLKDREEALKQQNFVAPNGMMVNMDNLINPFQLASFDPKLRQALAKNAFAIVPGDEQQLFHVYERNDYHQFPNFVTTDLFLQVFHMYFDCLLKEVEQEKFVPLLTNFVKQLYDAMSTQASFATDPNVKAAAQYNAAFFAIAHALLTGENNLPVAPNYTALVKEEINHVNDAETTYSTFLGYVPERKMPMFIYNTYRPRGHYTRSQVVERYFRGMMWLQTVPFGTDKEHQMQRAALIAEALNNNHEVKASYDQVFEPITFLMGTPDNITITQLYDVMTEQNVTAAKLKKGSSALKTLCQKVEQLGEEQTRIRPPFERTSRHKINFMPQRYQPDAEVLLRMVDYDNDPTHRGEPMGLDVMAAMGITAAERILINELKQDKQWSEYCPTLERMKKRMKEIDWKASVATTWMDALAGMNSRDERYPYFMQSSQWDKKNLNAMLASWAELKHDAILYAKQPMGAECGGGGLPEPITKGYVEPNVGFWQKAIELLDKTDEVLVKYDMQTEKTRQLSNRLREEAQFLLAISEKELKGTPISDEEYDHIGYIGATFENISLEILSTDEGMAARWYDVQGTDKKVALVADVYTANSDNNPAGGVLYEAVGPAHEIYVVVEIDGYLYLTRGAVFSYREFKRPLDEQRMTDEEWQEKLEEYPSTGIPAWMREIIVPLKKAPEANETIFYSTGC